MTRSAHSGMLSNPGQLSKVLRYRVAGSWGSWEQRGRGQILPVVRFSRCCASGSRLPRRPCLVPRGRSSLRRQVPSRHVTPPSQRTRNRNVHILAGASRRLTKALYALTLRHSAPSARGPPAWDSPGRLLRPLKTKARTATSPRPGRFFANAERRAPTGAWDSLQFDCLINLPEAD